jgi:hypothetical protein
MSSYNLPAAVGSASATGAEAVAIAAQPGGTNANGNATDSAGNLFVDFVWGSRPAQPNDERADGTPTPTEVYGAAQNGQWTTKSAVASARLNPALNNHSDIEAEWGGFPGFIAADGNYMITAASGDGTTVTYTSQNKLAAGDVVDISGLTASAYNLDGATVASADKLKFTVTDSANAGLITGQWYGKVQKTTARTAADGAGIGNIVVPNVLGNTTAVALDTLKDAGYEAANITTAAAAANAAITVTAIARTAGSTTMTFTAAGAGAAYAVGTKVTVSLFSGDDAFLNGTYTVTANATNTFSVTTTATTALALTEKAGAVVGVAGTIKTQSTAAGAASVATTATITVTPWAVAS